MITSTVYARVGLAGNPSDGFYGKTVSACVRNWSATIELIPSKKIEIIPNQQLDPLQYKSLGYITKHADRFGHYGALRLINATLAYFHRETGIEIQEGHGFSVYYESSIPRQVGLGGSSAIIVALLNCLFEFAGIDYEPQIRANLAWAVEYEELNMMCGLQDRVVQTYNTLIYMDFDKLKMEQDGYGAYIPMDAQLPPAFIVHDKHPRKTSGQVHNPVRYRFEEGDTEVLESMASFAQYAVDARNCIYARCWTGLSHIMGENFQLRLSLYGRDSIGEKNLQMIDIAKKHGINAKFPGSGGSVIGFYEDDEQYEKLVEDYHRAGFEIEKVIW